MDIEFLKSKIPLLIVCSFLIVLLIIWIVYYIRYRRVLSRIFCSRCYSSFLHTAVPLNATLNIPYSKLSTSTDNSCTFSFSIYISSWYQNLDAWKHVFHRGSEVDESCIISSSLPWNEIKDQCPGVWLSPKVNDMRIVLNGKRLEKSCTNSSSGTGSKETVVFNYVDIPNIPIGAWFHIAIIIMKNKLEIYKNGDLMQTSWFLESPIISDKNVYFGLGTTFSGFISNFVYIPNEIDMTAMKALYHFQKKNDGLKVRYM